MHRTRAGNDAQWDSLHKLGPQKQALAFRLVPVVNGYQPSRLSCTSVTLWRRFEQSSGMQTSISGGCLDVNRTRVLRPSSERPTIMYDMPEIYHKRPRSAIFSSTDEMVGAFLGFERIVQSIMRKCGWGPHYGLKVRFESTDCPRDGSWASVQRPTRTIQMRLANRARFYSLMVSVPVTASLHAMKTRRTTTKSLLGWGATLLSTARSKNSNAPRTTNYTPSCGQPTHVWPKFIRNGRRILCKFFDK